MRTYICQISNEPFAPFEREVQALNSEAAARLMYDIFHAPAHAVSVRLSVEQPHRRMYRCYDNVGRSVLVTVQVASSSTVPF